MLQSMFLILTVTWFVTGLFIDSCKRLKIMPGSDANGLGMFIFMNAHMYTYISYHPQYYHANCWFGRWRVTCIHISVKQGAFCAKLN
jgi:hypothetical protein